MASSTWSPFPDGASTTVTTRGEVLAAFGLALDTRWRTLSVRPHSTHYLTLERRPRVVRIVDQSRTCNAHQEAVVTERLREAGFREVPVFSPLESWPHDWSCTWTDHGEVAVYDYIPGEV